MFRNATYQGLVDACAMAIVRGDTGERLDLTVLRGIFFGSHLGNILSSIRGEVENLGGGIYTIQLADPALFQRRFPGRCLYLVLCPAKRPEGMVTELTEDMLPITLRPDEDGLQTGAVRASDDEIERYRKQESAAQRHRMQEQCRDGDQMVDEFMADLTDAVRCHVQVHAHHVGSDLETEFTDQLGDRSCMTVKELTGFAYRMGTTLLDIIRL